ncbi:hypothetical protein AAHE18_11G155400 [Arachis hypogaea]
MFFIHEHNDNNNNNNNKRKKKPRRRIRRGTSGSGDGVRSSEAVKQRSGGKDSRRWWCWVSSEKQLEDDGRAWVGEAVSTDFLGDHTARTCLKIPLLNPTQLV